MVTVKGARRFLGRATVVSALISLVTSVCVFGAGYYIVAEPQIREMRQHNTLVQQQIFLLNESLRQQLEPKLETRGFQSISANLRADADLETLVANQLSVDKAGKAWRQVSVDSYSVYEWLIIANYGEGPADILEVSGFRYSIGGNTQESETLDFRNNPFRLGKNHALGIFLGRVGEYSPETPTHFRIDSPVSYVDEIPVTYRTVGPYSETLSVELEPPKVYVRDPYAPWPPSL
jgi:hypothetical protein